MNAVENIIVKTLQGLFQFWHLFISPLFGQRCRFTPSCSQYAKESLEVHGLLVGVWMSVKRITRCNSLFPGGHDPVVGADKSKTSKNNAGKNETLKDKKS